MIIAGLQNLSLVDFPGCLVATVFVQGCNFHCGYCHNPELIEAGKRSDLTEQDVISYITRRKDIIEGVCITGGEPALHKDLPDFIKRIKDLGFKVKLDTNGSDPGQLEHLLRERLLDYIALDIKTALSKYGLVTARKGIEKTITESICLTLLAVLPYEFRTTCVPGIVDEDDFRSIRDLVQGSKKYCLQQFRPSITYDKSFKEVKPYNREELHKFRDILKGSVREVEIRGI